MPNVNLEDPPQKLLKTAIFPISFLILGNLFTTLGLALGVVVRDTADSAVGLGFDYRSGQVGHGIANGSPPLLRFFGAVLPRR